MAFRRVEVAALAPKRSVARRGRYFAYRWHSQTRSPSTTVLGRTLPMLRQQIASSRSRQLDSRLAIERGPNSPHKPNSVQNARSVFQRKLEAGGDEKTASPSSTSASHGRPCLGDRELFGPCIVGDSLVSAEPRKRPTARVKTISRMGKPGIRRWPISVYRMSRKPSSHSFHKKSRPHSQKAHHEERFLHAYSLLSPSSVCGARLASAAEPLPVLYFSGQIEHAGPRVSDDAATRRYGSGDRSACSREGRREWHFPESIRTFESVRSQHRNEDEIQRAFDDRIRCGNAKDKLRPDVERSVSTCQKHVDADPNYQNRIGAVIKFVAH